MRLADLTPSLLRRTIDIYLHAAYERAAPRGRELSVPDAQGPQDLLKLFLDETRQQKNAVCHRYVMRLGNRNYPFMKLVLQEHLVADEYFFCVDTHDDVKIRPDFPEYEAWQATRRFNCEVKTRIESAWVAAGVPTYGAIKDQVLCRPPAACGQRCELILVVDDERDICDAVESLLAARGLRVIKAHDGRAGLRAVQEHHPDLIVLDYELPEMDGLQVIDELRRSDGTRHIPVLLATAGALEYHEIRKANGFLVKPFQEESLYTLIDTLLLPREAR